MSVMSTAPLPVTMRLGEQRKTDRRRIPDTTTCTKPLENAYGDWFLIYCPWYKSPPDWTGV
jgi:hypothetical protein